MVCNRIKLRIKKYRSCIDEAFELYSLPFIRRLPSCHCKSFSINPWTLDIPLSQVISFCPAFYNVYFCAISTKEIGFRQFHVSFRNQDIGALGLQRLSHVCRNRDFDWRHVTIPREKIKPKEDAVRFPLIQIFTHLWLYLVDNHPRTTFCVLNNLIFLTRLSRLMPIFSRLILYFFESLPVHDNGKLAPKNALFAYG